MSVMVAEQLNFDVPGVFEIFLDQQGSVAKGGLGLAASAGQRGFDLGLGSDNPHPLASASGRSLDQDRQPDRQNFVAQPLARLVLSVVAGNHRHARLGHQATGGAF